MDYTIVLNAQELSALMQALGKFPFEQVAGIIGKIESQVRHQHGNDEQIASNESEVH